MNETQTVSDRKMSCVVPSSVAQVGIITKYTFVDYFRSRRFFVLLVITVLIGLLLTALVYFRPGTFTSSPLAFYSNWWGQSITFVIILSGIFFGGDAISGEFQNKTGYFGIPNPIRRSSIYLGKWIGAFIAATIMFFVFTSMTVGNGLIYFGLSIPFEFGASFLFAWFYLAAVLGFTFFFSSLFKTSSISILMTVILFLFVFNLLGTFIMPLIQIEPWFIITYGAGIIGNVLSVPYPPHEIVTNLGPQAGFSISTFNATIPEGLAIITVYFVVTAVLGLLFFERKEFT
jgi:ABC-2 type transport system permease protein